MTTADFGRTEYRAANTDKGAILHRDGYMAFGRWDGSEFIVSHAKPGRNYKTAAGADRAALRWLNS